ncbi:hypothetical protein C8T65DRAFT_592488, partial [Cerioporus squamosus]
QRWCPTQGNIEIEEQLEGLRRRLLLLGFADPEIAVVDNCCHVKAAISKVFPDIAVVLDVWHFVQRYLACVLGGTKNPCRSEVAQDITNAILKSRASNGNPATYWSQEEQERRLVLAYEKWVEDGTVWSAAAEKVHADQLAHVQKGCLARPRDDIPSDGSRIEASHKGWNGLQRSFASGLVVLTYLAHDYVLRRNIRTELASGAASPFIESTYGSHHVRLVNFLANRWNNVLIDLQKTHGLPAGMLPLPTLQPAPSGETFGLAKMTAATAAHYTFVKQEPEDELLDLSSHTDPTSILDELGIDPKLAHLLPSHARIPGSWILSSRLHHSSPPHLQYPRRARSGRLSLSTSPHLATSTPSGCFRPTLQRQRSVAPALPSARPPSRDKPVLFTLPTRAPCSLISPRSHWTRRLPRRPVYSWREVPRVKPSLQRLSNFFAPFVQKSVMVAGHGNYQTPCLPIVRITGLTRSQQVFSLATGLDLRSITFARSEKDAFFLFMNLRKQLQWATYKMTPRDWVAAATLYNHAVEKKNASEGKALVRKTPRALLDKLHEIELAIIHRVSKGNYKSQAGTTKFWYKHSHAVPLRLVKPAERTRRTPVCKRCKAIMYPGGENCPQNHRCGICSDGARTTSQTIIRSINGQTVRTQEEPPQWPQPIGIFTDGKKFNARRFVAALEEMYEHVVKNGDVDSERTVTVSGPAPLLVPFRFPGTSTFPS